MIVDKTDIIFCGKADKRMNDDIIKLRLSPTDLKTLTVLVETLTFSEQRSMKNIKYYVKLHNTLIELVIAYDALAGEFYKPPVKDEPSEQPPDAEEIPSDNNPEHMRAEHPPEPESDEDGRKEEDTEEPEESESDDIA